MAHSRRNVLVTGAAGFVGRFMVAALDPVYDVVGLGHEARPQELPSSIAWIEADLLDPWATVDLPGNLFAVIHLAGHTVPSAFKDDSVVRQNVEMTQNILEHIDAERFLLASSALVYAPGQEPRAEDSPIGPQGLYGRSKQLCEDVAREFSGTIDMRIARPFNHIGPGMQPDLAIPSIVRRVRAARSGTGPITMHGQDSTRDFVDVRDVVAAYRALIELDAPEYDTFNVCTGRPTSISTVVRAALTACGMQREIRFAEAAVSGDDTSCLVGDPSRLQAATGWSPRFTLEASVRDMLEAS
jgi:nucleoside-diphosphate-sugar epimerase